MSFHDPMSSLLISDAPIEHQTGVDVCTGGMRIATDDGPLGGGEQDELDVLIWMREWAKVLLSIAIHFSTPNEEDALHCSVGAPKPSVRFPTSDALHNKVPWDTMTGNLIQQCHDKIKHEAYMNGKIKIFTEAEIERITRNFSTPIGKGAFGKVYKGILDGDNKPVHVAVKKYINEDWRETFMEEVRIHSKISHKNVVKLIGYCIGEHTLVSVMGYMSKGNLNDRLHHSEISTPFDERRRIILKECAEALRDIIHSMHLLSVNRVCHCDIKPANILLDDNLTAKLTHFGVPRLLVGGKFSGQPSAERGIETSIGSHLTRRPRYLSVHHHPLMQILPSARKWKRTSAGIFKGCISAKPKYETPNAGAGPVSEYIIRKFFGIWNGLTVNESQQHSHRGSSRSNHGKKAVNTKTSDSWIIATAAPHHATGNHNLLSGFIMEHDDQFVHAVNHVPMKVLARGAVVTDTLILPDVWFVPGLTENLVSVSQLAELDHSIGFGRGECCIRSARDAKIVGKGRLQKGGHYVLDYLKVPLAI